MDRPTGNRSGRSREGLSLSSSSSPLRTDRGVRTRTKRGRPRCLGERAKNRFTSTPQTGQNVTARQEGRERDRAEETFDFKAEFIVI